ncbi:hypothetical protein P8629_02620 [Hydrogenovibrio sp. 3SP14C1]|uniref:hypothetical protein n=1 Tax=Hydrogenovibrio sp. 3SP14C1 TaxID=3038774 RepID=UPI002417B195|nr:hypothetical protein [Hydrogenovibrio sp. 3SP14C1]MDG4811890.1 hypothetical protein [Hydrogenovibrio sp. 3SP14C1]
MSDTADDLLDELSQLEDASADMQKEVKTASDNNKKLEESGNADSLDSAALSLEAAKTAQLAAEQSQNAADAAIKLSHEQKAQVMELSDSNIAWRQSLRTASNDLKSARNAVTTMMTVSIVFSVISVGIMGWLLNSLNKKNETLKGDVFDIINTENTLFNKNLNLKIDQLSSLIEALAADIQRLSRSTPAQDRMPARGEKRPSLPEPEAKPKNQPEKSAEPTANSKENQASAMDAKTIRPDFTELKNEMHQLSGSREKQLKHIQGLLDQILNAQEKIQATALHQASKKQAMPTTTVVSSGLTDEQVKKLNGIAWAVSTQRKLLKEIQKTLSAQKPAKATAPDKTPKALNKIDASLKHLSTQVRELKTQQDHIQKKVQGLENVTQELAKRPQPYSYRSEEPPVETINE